MPLIGEKVTMPRSKSLLEVNHVSRDGDEADLQLPGTNLQWFRVKTDTLTFVDRKSPARTSNPFTTGKPPRNGLAFIVPKVGRFVEGSSGVFRSKE